ncbi:Family with sequence similarity 21, member [Nesidiocoris tenuis]|uniref:Family with sequence similarity 21, member n=1 Tax=Nesidiocoris tenuis TaxID=355587 RepID=A0ABN7ACL2_9HEMI|nr:Family with sequence similarity 21, member [Nesidiocoris tenuis]
MRERQCAMDTTDGFGIFNVNRMIESSRNWSLANDVELLKSLEKISQNIINDASLTLRSMDNLEDSLDETFLRVRTVANKFQAIADNQFIENRVQEEEDDFVLANDNTAETTGYPGSNEEAKTQVLEAIRECSNAISKKQESTNLSGVYLREEMANNSPVLLASKNLHEDSMAPSVTQRVCPNSEGVLQHYMRNNEVDDFSESEEDIDETDRAQPTPKLPAGIQSVLQEIHSVVPKWDPDADRAPVGDVLGRRAPKVTNIVPKDTKSRVEQSSKKLSSETPAGNESATKAVSPDQRAEPEVPKSPMVAHSPERIDKKHEAEVIAPVKTNKNDTVPSSTVSRDQLLSGANFASFKEDLARVLSGGRPIRKISSSDSDGSKDDFSSPSRDVSAGKNEEVPPTPKQRSSFPNSDSSVLSPFGGISTNKSTTPVSPTSTDQNFPDSRVTLPAVSTNVLESLSKNRAKVKGRRRPPSRKHRQSQIEGDSKPILSPGYDEDPSKETPSEESSRTESVSTQPGSNILSPATDEEDLFVLPAFEPSAEHPSKGIFFGNSLLSPGASIDEGRSPSPLFPSTAKDSLFADSPRLDEFIVPETKQEKRPSPVPIQRTTTSTKRSQFAGAPHSRLDDLFSESPPKVDGPAKSSASLSDENGPSSPDFDIFSNSAVPKTARPDQLDLFSGESKASTFSSSPPLFSDFADLKSSSKTGKSTSKTKSSGLKWDLLGSDDLGEDLFRPQIKQSSSSNKSTSDTGKVKPNSPVPLKKKQDDLFAPPAASKKKASTDAGGLFDDVNEFLSSDIFSDSSSFMRLSLPKNQKENSLFGSDDDDDDDSLFKTSKKTSASMPPSLEKPSKSQGTMESKPGNVTMQSHEPVNDPLSSLDNME